MSAGDEPEPQALVVLIDTNVILDLVLAREPWASEAKPFWDALDDGRVIAYVAASILTDVYYVCRKQVGVERARGAVELCLQRFAIFPVDRALMEAALALSGPDFEDDIEIAAANAIHANLIVTRDAAGFSSSPIPAADPATVVARLAGS